MIYLPRNDQKVPVAILAAGDYPSAGIAGSVLEGASKVVCCDGAAASFIASGRMPYAIVGDCDSLGRHEAELCVDLIRSVSSQDTNDLTKAVIFCAGEGLGEVVILGATGRREDHTLANIALLAQFIAMPGIRSVRMITDYAVFDAITPLQLRSTVATPRILAGGSEPGAIVCDYDENNVETCISSDGDSSEAEVVLATFGFESWSGMPVSLFTPHVGTFVTTAGLRYPLENAALAGLWSGTLNEALDSSFSVSINRPSIVCRIIKD